MKRINVILFTIPILTMWFVSCNSDNDAVNIPGSSANNDDTWNIPRGEIFDGGPGKDGIPALEDPDLINAEEAFYLSDDDLILGYKNGNEVIAYPHPILDWHEIINDKVNDHAFAVTYCPLTGTGVGWNRVIDGEETTFGVSGLLYNSNLIPYDRNTDSNWSQIRLDCVNGTLRGNVIETFSLVETTWSTWKGMFPATRVVSTQTGHSRNYSRYPYGDYKTNNSRILFPFTPNDTRLGTKERVHGIIIDGQAKAYRFGSFSEGTNLIQDVFKNEAVVIVGNQSRNFIVSFSRVLDDGTELNFSIAPEQNTESPNPVIMVDQEGTKWNVFGEAVEGPRTGSTLVETVSFIGYWFSWGAFYPGLEIYEE